MENLKFFLPSLNFSPNGGDTPYDKAESNGHHKVMELLGSVLGLHVRLKGNLCPAWMMNRTIFKRLVRHVIDTIICQVFVARIAQASRR